MDSFLRVPSDGLVVDAGRSRRALALVVAVASAVAALVMMLVHAASPASAQISIGSFICPILRSLAAAFSGFGFLAGIFNSILSAFGC